MMGLVLRHIHFQTKKTSSPDKTQYRDPRQTRRRLNPYSLAIVVAVARPYTPRRESIFVLSLLDLLQRRRYMEGDLRIGLLVPPLGVLFGILLPKLGLWFGRHEEQFILEFLQSTLVARMANPN